MVAGPSLLVALTACNGAVDLEAARLDAAGRADRGEAVAGGAVAPWAEATGGTGWMAHPAADTLLTCQPLPEAGPYAWVALRRHHSTFDDEVAVRPYVFSLQDGRVHDLWRGTALGRPLVAARHVPDLGLLCALHRDDSFARPDPATRGREWAAWRWNGFGFDHVPDGATSCASWDRTR